MEPAMIYKEIILCLMFGCIGFVLSFFVARTINIALLLLMVWVPLKVIEKYGTEPDWGGFYKLKDILLSLWRVLIDLLSNMLNMATTGSLVLFVLGGLTGFIINMRLKEKHG
jgi:hypothetical protein